MPDGSVDDAAVLDALFAGSPQGLFVLDADRRVTRYNPSARGVRALPSDEVVGHDVRAFAPDMEPEIGQLIDEVLTTGEPLRGRLLRGRSPSEPGRTLAVEVSLFPLRGGPGLVGVVEDVTERQAAADRLAVLSAVHRTVGATLDVQATADALVDALVPDFADAASVDLLDDDPAGAAPPSGPLPTSVPLRRVAFAAPESVEPYRRTGDSRPFPFPTPYTQVLSDAHARLVQVTPDDPWLATDPDGFAVLLGRKVHSMIVAPLTARDTVLGLLTLYRSRADAFEEADLDVARQAASTAAVHLDNARSYRREHTVASALQRRLQPGVSPRLSAVETAHVYLPESAGGAWFDVIPLSGTRVALVVGDVAGHGIEAAATMGQLRVALRTLTSQDLETDEVLTHLDEVAGQLTAVDSREAHPYLATCAVTVYDPVSRQCTMMRAGHPAPVLVDPDGSPIEVDVPLGPPLGAESGAAFVPAVTQLPPGCLIAHVTNGLLGSGGGDGGDGDADAVHRLEHVLATPSRPLQELCDTAVYRMTPSRYDDAVLLLARTECLPPDRVADWTLPADASVVGTARRLVGQQLTAWGLGDRAFTTEIIVSELVTNAILHGAGPVRLRLIHDDERLLAEVTDASSAGPHLRHARAGDEGGRGLYIVMRLSAHWGVRHGREDKTIWSEQRLGEETPEDLFATVDAFDTAGV
ncbi:ATP-binding SpoIIE family protein phosphatase [Streptomyces werraensis]|uniref:ATP-binding SpoIIE family protein phosphatase n=1 Tax=Streptomyces werraensis TaxID=68284 RepID=UPI00368E373E